MAISYIGSTLSVVASTPATEDASGYAALSYSEVGKIISVGELGDTSEDINFDRLKDGRKVHVNGVKDLGEIPCSVEFDADDAGQDIVRAQANTNTVCSWKVTDTDGVSEYFQGTAANYRTTERTANTYKGANFVIRGTSGITTVEV